MGIVSSILPAAIVLGVIIMLHELGHFLVARYFKIRIDTFSIGFGPRLIGFRRGDTDYRISALPFGGYVKMAGDTPSENLTGAPHEFLSKPKWQRFLVAAAGPAMNVILAVVLLTGLYMYGRRIPETLVTQARVGMVEPGSPAALAGVREGDLLASLDGKEKPNWQDVESQILMSAGKSLPLILERNGQYIDTSISPVKKAPQDMGYVGMGPYSPVIVKEVTEPSAVKAGLKANDEIVVANGVNLKESSKSIQSILQSVETPDFPITVIRDGQTIELRVTPVVKEGHKLIGINLVRDPGPTVMVKYGFTEALSKSISTNIEYGKTILKIIGMLFKREASLKQLDGPIGIVRASGEALNEGIATLINLMALISLNLGLLNILPIPVLDGGLMLMLIVESLMGRDMSLKLKERIVQVSVVALLMLTVLVLYNDVVKLIPTSQSAP